MGAMKFPDNTVFGLDIGTRSVVGTVGYRKPTGEFVILAQKSLCHETRAMLDGQIHDINKVTETVCKVKAELENELDASLKEVCIAAAGRVLKTVSLRVEYDLGDEMPVTEDMICAMELMGMEKAQAKLRSSENDGTEFYCVGYSVVKYYLGNIVLTNLEGHRASVISADIIATFLPMDVIDGLYKVCEKSGLQVLNLTLEPIAAINIAIPEKFRLLNLALVDVGAGTSDICITQEGSITGYGMLPCAGDFLSESIMYELLTDFSTAESIKLAASTKRKKVAYKDVLGVRHSMETAKVNEILAGPVEKLTGLIADKIKELNGDKKVGAVFIVGGGGKNPEFAKALAKAMELPEQRVALRGSEVFSGVVTPDHKPVKDPMLVTPIGICMNYYDKSNNLINVTINGTEIKLYNNGKTNVMDAVLSGGMSDSDVFPKRGRDLVFMVNGTERIVKGKKGEYSVITVNGEEGAVTTPLKSNDVITIKPSTAGTDAECRIGDLKEAQNDIYFIVNGKRAGFPRLIYVNGKKKEKTDAVSSGDDIKILDNYPLKRVIEALNAQKGFKITVNNKALDMNAYDPEEKIFENYIIDVEAEKKEDFSKLVKAAEIKQEKPVEKPAEKPVEKPEPVIEKTVRNTSKIITVFVNGTPVTLSGKAEYTFVNVLDFYPFNTASMQGNRIVCKRNGIPADFFTPVFEGDKLDLYWSKD